MNAVNTKRMHLLSVACGLLLTLITLPAVAQAPAQAVPAFDPLDKDPRLNRAITLDETGIALKDLLHKLSDHGLTLTPLPLCAEQKVQVHLNHRPLRTLMSSLAELLSGTWQPTPDKTGYQFSQTEATVSRRRRWWSLFMGEHEPSVASRRAQILQWMRASLPQVHYSFSNGATEAADIQRMRTEHETTHNLFAKLPSELQEQLAQRIANESYLSNSPMIESSLEPEGALVVPVQDLPQSTRDAVASAAGPYFRGKGLPTYLQLHNSGMLLRGVFLDATGQPYSHVGGDPGSAVMADPALVFNQQELAKAVKRLGKQASPTWKELATYQNSTVWKNGPAVQARNRSLYPPHRSEVLSWLASKGKFEFVADYYSLPFAPWSDEEQEQELPQELDEELDFRALEQDMSWKRRTDKILLFRDNRWYRNDELEVPNDLLERWAKEVAELNQAGGHERGGVPLPIDYAGRVLDFRADVESKLTQWQIQNGLCYAILPLTPQQQTEILGLDKQARGQKQLWDLMPAAPGRPKSNPKFQMPFALLSQIITYTPATFRFYIALTDEQKTALLRGELPYAALSPSQQELARYVQPMISLALRQTSLLQPNQPLLLGLAQNRGGGGHWFIGDGSMVANRTGIWGIILSINSPQLTFIPVAK